MIPDSFIWLAWSITFLIPWIGLFVAFSEHRRAMLWASLFTTPFGLTEPLFVPEYWSPPSVFDLALRTGFDIESLVFCFGIGGVGAVLFQVVTGRKSVPLPERVRRDRRHRFHQLALVSPFLIFVPLYFLPWNPIYPGITAMVVGAAATWACRPDLGKASLATSVLFLCYYAVFLAGLEVASPGYIERVWNLEALSGLSIIGFPLEELIFAAAFGAYWAGVYGHFTWHRLESTPA